MVRLGTFPKRHSTEGATSAQPVPECKSSASGPIIATETTTTRTEVLATTTTTQFFTLPTWTKRVWNHQNDGTKAKPGETQVRAQTMAPTDVPSLKVNKDLPPTPPQDSTSISRFADSGEVAKAGGEPRASHFPSSDPPNSRMTSYGSDSVPPSSSTNALARASLSVGLSHVLPSASSSSSSVNIIPTSPSQPVTGDKNASSRAPRKSRSTQKLKAMLTLDGLQSPRWPTQETLTTPGMTSPSASSLLDGFFSTSASKKGKEKAVGPGDHFSTSQVPRPRSSSIRRPSFWTRKKSDPSLKANALEIEVAIPPVPPLSPFGPQIEVRSANPQPTGKGTPDAPGLSRSRSLNGKLKPPAPKHTERRPLTADASASHSLKPTPITPPLPDSSQQMTYPLVNPPDSPRPRQRANTNPSLLNRLSLSLNRLSTGSSLNSPWTPSTHSPQRPFPTNDIKNPSANPPESDHLQSPLTPRESTTQPPSAEVIAPREDDTPLRYLERLQSVTSRAEIGGILASSADSIHTEALRVYMKQFSFDNNPLDVSLRKLLMETGLPRETQQIDRVMEAFAHRYLECNPGLFASKDHPYILSFSLIMLHTDHFNKSNKRKMTKPDYVKNTRLPHVPPEVLDYFYDNITFAPFIFIEDYADTNGQALGSSPSLHLPIISSTQPSIPAVRSGKVDPYFLISQNWLDPLRVDVATLIPNDCPLYFYGTIGPWNEADLRQIFARASEVEVCLPDSTRSSSLFNRGSSAGFEGSLLSPNPPDDVRLLKLARAGVLQRKDDILLNGKKANSRRWRTCCVALSETHLLFFRDPSTTNQLRPFDGQVPVPRSTIFKPDEAVVLKEVVAIYDRLFDKDDRTFRLVLSDGRHILLQASDETEMNAWIAGINYASAFCSANIRMRPVDLAKVDVELTGVAAAASHLHDLQHRFHSSSSRLDLTLQNETPKTKEDAFSASTPLPRVSLALSVHDDVDTDVPTAPEIEGAAFLKATFDQVKADLAAGRRADSTSHEEEETLLNTSSRPSMSSLGAESSALTTRAKFSLARIKRLDSLIAECEVKLAPDLRVARNLAILTPFRKDTRDRLSLTAQRLATKIFLIRIELTKFNCHRHVLLADLSSEELSWHRAKTLALQVATDTLDERRADGLKRISQEDIDDFKFSPSIGNLSSVDASHSHHLRPASSVAESFYSALDMNFDSPTEPSRSPTFLTSQQRMTESPEPNPPTSLSASPQIPNSSSHTSCSPRPSLAGASISRTSSESTSHERFYTAPESPTEVAEEWNHTRCAQRVSLVRVPSEMRLLNRFRSSGQMTWMMN